MAKADRKVIQDYMAKGETEKAKMQFIRDAIDETNFPFRKATGAAITDGMGGKMHFQFASWPIEYGHMLTSWAARGRWGQLARFAGMSEAARRTMENTFGVDISTWSGLRALKPGASPVVRFLDNLRKATMGASDEVNSAKEEIIKNASSLLIPAGVQLNKIKDFQRNIAMSKKDPTLKDGEYAFYNRDGKKTMNAPFSDLFWTMLGFPMVSKTEQSELSTSIYNDRNRIQSKRDESMKLYREGKIEEAEKIWTQYNIRPSASELSSQYTPALQRAFDSLPMDLKLKYVDKIFK
jgi:hypothetical protein